MPELESQPKICDYEGSTYRTDFWEGRGRGYEDRVERKTLQRLLPISGYRLLEVGAGFGRLTTEWGMYEQVVLLDYSYSQLQYAREHLGASDRYIYVAADAYRLPFRPGVFDGVTVIRVLHHMADVPAVLARIRDAMIPDGIFILEYANKRNLKALLRYAAGRQSWSPFDRAPLEFVELNFDFHPRYIERVLGEAGFGQQEQIPVSFLRLGLLKNNLPTGFLVGMDTLLQRTGLLYSPSVFTKNIALGSSPNNLNVETIFACPKCGEVLKQDGSQMLCTTDDLRWAIREGIYDFKSPL